MRDASDNDSSSIITSMIGEPFAWCAIPAGPVLLEDASAWCGTPGGKYHIVDFWMARYPVTNVQYQAFIDDPDGYINPGWWEFSPQAWQWHMNHPRPRPTAFPGDTLPRTRVSWFEGMAFCAWLTAKWKARDRQATSSAWVVRLPTEQEWQRAAVGDTGWLYPWGNEIDESRANYGNHNGQTTPVYRYEQGQSPYSVMDMIGNVWERCLSGWGVEEIDLNGYNYRAMRGGAWNSSRTEYIRAIARYGHPPRGQLNDAGFRIACGEVR